MFKNVASQKIAVFAWDSVAGAPKTGDAANISAQISKDGGATAATDDVAPTELDAADAKGIYIFDMTQPETNADLVILSPVSGTADIDLEPVIIHTIPAASVDWQNGGRLDLLIDAIPTTAMRGTDNAALASVMGALNDAAAAGDPTDADTLVQYIKQLLNVLVGSTGIGAFPAEAAPANAVSLAEVIRAIHADVTGLNGSAMAGTNSAALASVLGAAVGASISADIAAVKSVADGIPTTAMRGTDNAALASVATETRLAELDAGNLPTDVAAIPTTAMRGTDNAATAAVLGAAVGASVSADIAAVKSVADGIPTTAMRGTENAALASVATETRLAELDAGNLPTDVAAIPTTAMRGTDSAATEAKQDIIDAIVDELKTVIVTKLDSMIESV